MRFFDTPLNSFFYYYCCAGRGYIVVFTKVLTMCQIYHTWFQPLHCSLSSVLPNSWKNIKILHWRLVPHSLYSNPNPFLLFFSGIKFTVKGLIKLCWEWARDMKLPSINDSILWYSCHLSDPKFLNHRGCWHIIICPQMLPVCSVPWVWWYCGIFMTLVFGYSV
jgi:hypothetical protein